MGIITVVNNTAGEIYVCITKTGGNVDQKGTEKFFTLAANGGNDTWERSQLQIIRFARSQTPGVTVETLLGVPDTTVNIY